MFLNSESRKAAQAAPGDVTMQLSQGNFDLNPGDKRGLTVRLTNAGNQNQSAKISVSGPGALGGDVTIQTSDPGCTGSGSTGVNCTVDVPKDNGTKDVALTLVAKNPVSLGQGQTKQDNGSVALEFGETKNFSVTLHGPSQAPMVTEVSGTVTDANGAVFWKADMDIDCDGQRTSQCNENTDCCFQADTAFHQSDGKPLNAAKLP